MITSILMLKVPQEKQGEALDILQSVSNLASLKRDSVSSRVYESRAEEGTILYIEEWKNQEALHQHIQSDLYRRVLTVMDLASEPPNIRFCNFEQGLELIQSLRQEKT